MSASKAGPVAGMIIFVLLALMLSGCATDPAAVQVSEPAAAVGQEYDSDSWKSMIDSECRSFFDGCNQCRQEPGKAGLCTRMACQTYQQPRCLDDEATAQSSSQKAPQQIEYSCDDDNRFSVSYHEFVQDDQRLPLQDDEVMFSDHQTRTNHRLQRERSASGESYRDASGFQFFAKGNEALVMQQGERLYSNCSVQS